MATIFHIISKPEAKAAEAASLYQPSNFANEGFIHCSYANQVCRVANSLYKGRADLALSSST